jgi:hypothetical protein
LPRADRDRLISEFMRLQASSKNESRTSDARHA